MIPTDPNIVLRRVSLDEVTERDRIDDRLSCLKVLFGTTIGLNRDSVNWCPDDSPPTASKSIAWLWFCRPDPAPLLYTAAPDDLRELMVFYHHDRLSDWWALTLERRQSQADQSAMIRRDQINPIKTQLLRWAKQQKIPLHQIEFVVPFVESDFGISAWFFFETDEQLGRAEEEGWSAGLTSQLRDAFRRLGYPADRLSEIRSRFDSHENVVRDYEGSYFYRLR